MDERCIVRSWPGWFDSTLLLGETWSGLEEQENGKGQKKKALISLGILYHHFFQKATVFGGFFGWPWEMLAFFLSGLDPTRYIGLKKKKRQIGELLLGLTREMVRWGACQLGVGPQKQWFFWKVHTHPVNIRSPYPRAKTRLKPQSRFKRSRFCSQRALLEENNALTKWAAVSKH